MTVLSVSNEFTVQTDTVGGDPIDLAGAAVSGAQASATLSLVSTGSQYVYGRAKDPTTSEGWKWQSMNRLSGGNGARFVIRGVGNHGHWLDNSIRIFDLAAALQAPQGSTDGISYVKPSGGPGNYAPQFGQYDNHYTPLLPAEMTGDVDTLLWMSYGAFQLGNINAWSHARLLPRSGDALLPIASISTSNPAVVTFVTVSHADNFTKVPDENNGGALTRRNMYIYAPGCSLHDQVIVGVQASPSESGTGQTSVILTGVNGATVTGFVSGGAYWTDVDCTQASFLFPGPRLLDTFIKDPSSLTNNPYNVSQFYDEARKRCIAILGSAGGESPRIPTFFFCVEANPNYPAEPQRFRVSGLTLTNAGPSGFVPRSLTRNACTIIGDWLYVAGGSTSGSPYTMSYLFHRVRLTDGYCQRLRDLPANSYSVSIAFAMMSYDVLRRRIVFSADRAIAFDVDTITDTTTIGGNWVELFTDDQYYHKTTNPSGLYHRVSHGDMKHVPYFDWHVIRNGAEVMNGLTEGEFRGQFSLLRLPTTWIRPFTTGFDATENPISEESKWLKKFTSHKNVRTTGGYATDAAYITEGVYDDNYARLSTSAFAAPGDNYEVVATVRKGTGANYEIELLLRVEDTPNSIHCYEVLVNTGGSGELVRWNGAMGSFQELAAAPYDTRWTHSIANGDKIKATVTGTNPVLVNVYHAPAATPTVFTLLASLSDDHANRKQSGQPGIGFFQHAANNNLGAHGWSDFTVTAI